MLTAKSRESPKSKAEGTPGRTKPKAETVERLQANSLWHRLARVQAKLTVSAPGDPQEREADRVADQVMRMPDTDVKRSTHLCIQRRVPDSGTGAGAGYAPPVVHDVLSSSGQPLDASTRGFMEPRFGHDFSSVRIHIDAKAEESALAVNALAFTFGRDIVFARGRYAPQTMAGRQLLAHELAHVAQQQGAGEGAPARIEISEPGTTAEREADQTARTVMECPPDGRTRLDAGMSAATLQRQADVPASCDKREPDAKAVAAIIDSKLDHGRSVTYTADELQDAWFRVRNRREEPGGANCCSAELAAAEHYLYARFAVAHRDYSPFEMKALVWGYGYLKFRNTLAS